MATPSFFHQIHRSYIDVPITPEEGIDTGAFLEATESLIKLFDSMGSAFASVKADMQGNVTKIRTKFLSDPINLSTLQSIVLAEKSDKKKTATEALLWLKRALEFTSAGLRRSLDQPTEELSVSFSKAYEVTLAQFHSFLIRPVFALAMKACPLRKDFYAKLAGSESPEDLVKQMSEWLSALEHLIGILIKFYVAGNYDKL
ncbi:glycolipid transfer protein domain-containing protein [Polychytrium aggregatum]|uniref:glycolipid transfer protein domain-containing protein n=1 Tax=Polychytrium aggregatum TaxID=110093 RepID=UPI0022FDF824|nr:glycolipid transfer protein domain-containing protein [Polychytrium aggregatum]KAI9202879.1 glycolipid transfer protein domain-containing protein [Polychytrium aggregatum]